MYFISLPALLSLSQIQFLLNSIITYVEKTATETTKKC